LNFDRETDGGKLGNGQRVPVEHCVTGHAPRPSVQHRVPRWTSEKAQRGMLIVGVFELRRQQCPHPA